MFKKNLINLNYIINVTKIIPPRTIIEKINNQGFNCKNSEKYEFLELTEDDENIFFKKIECIVDYDKLEKLSFSEINDNIIRIQKIITNIVNDYNTKTSMEKNILYSKIDALLNLYKLQEYDIKDYLLYKQRKIKLNIPSNKIKSLIKKKKYE